MARLRTKYYNGMWMTLIPTIVNLHRKKYWPAKIRRNLLEIQNIGTPRVHCVPTYKQIPSRTVIHYILLKQGLKPYKKPRPKEKEDA